MRKNYLVFGQPLIEQDEINEILDSLNSTWLGTGPKVARFENDFKRYKNCGYTTAVNSGTAALHLALRVLNLQPGDEVIAPAMTFCATINAIIHSGATPVRPMVDLGCFHLSAGVSGERSDEPVSGCGCRTAGGLGRICDRGRLFAGRFAVAR